MADSSDSLFSEPNSDANNTEEYQDDLAEYKEDQEIEEEEYIYPRVSHKQLIPNFYSTNYSVLPKNLSPST